MNCVTEAQAVAKSQHCLAVLTASRTILHACLNEGIQNPQISDSSYQLSSFRKHCRLCKVSDTAACKTATLNMPNVLDLPDEILEKILAEAATPDPVATRTIKHDKRDKSTWPSTWLCEALLKIAACKKLQNLALDAYFIHTQLTATIGDAYSPNKCNRPFLPRFH